MGERYENVFTKLIWNCPWVTITAKCSYYRDDHEARFAPIITDCLLYK